MVCATGVNLSAAMRTSQDSVYRRSASLLLREACGRAFLKRDAKLGCGGIARRKSLFTSPRVRGEVEERSDEDVWASQRV
jgi:hypothetical protein